MSNLIITAALGYDWSHVNNLVKSYRQCSLEKIVIITDNKSMDFKDEAKKNNVELFYANLNQYKYINRFNALIPFFQKNEFSQIRYAIYKEVLSKFPTIENFIICDSRDVFFQNNPFKKSYKKDLIFFLEEQKIKNDKRNSLWLKNTVGIKEFEKIKDNLISCCGVVIGNYDGIRNYVSLMSEYLYKKPFQRSWKHKLIFRPIKPYDQGIHNFLIYNNFFSNYEIVKNQNGLVANISYMSNFKKNKFGKMINDLGEEYDIVHGYDRKIDFFYNQIKKLI